MTHLVLLAIALAMDSAAAAVSLGAGGTSLRPLLTAALLFGTFQAGMSGLGWLGGMQLATWVSAWDHWLAFVLLSLLGARAIREGLSDEEDTPRPEPDLQMLLALAVATSIDALAAGVTLPMLEVEPAVALAVIGGVAAALSLAGGALGRVMGDRFGSRLDVFGGVVLVALGIKILVEHLSAG